MRSKNLAAVIFVIFLVSSCAAGTTEYIDSEAGFFSGIWHGWIAPFSIILHFIYDDGIRIYETRNSGIGYDIGFYVAIISGFGSLSLTRRKDKKRLRKK